MVVPRLIILAQQKIEKTGIGGRKTAGKKMYDKESRERKFLPQWTKDRSWLAYEEYKQLMLPGGPPISRQFCPRFRSTTEINRFSWV
jgi:hypothetical protein